MPTQLEEARTLLVTRLEEIDRERRQLLEAIGQLDALIEVEGPATGRGSRRGRKRVRTASTGNGKKRRPRRRSRAPRGEREKQLLKSIKAHPDYRVSEHAREVGVSPQQLYPLLRRLVDKNAIVKEDSRYTVKAST